MKISEMFFRMYIQPALGCFLRKEEGEANAAANTAADVGANLGSVAAGERGVLQPFAQREMSAEHFFDPSQIGELLTHAGLGAGAESGKLESAMQRQAATTGNAAGATKGLQELARDRMKDASATSTGVAAQDVMGAKQLNQQGANLMSGLYGENLKGQLGAMGQEAGDINAGINASQHGWLQNTEGVIKTLQGK